MTDIETPTNDSAEEEKSAKDNGASQDSAKIKQGIIDALLEEEIAPGAEKVVVSFMRRQLAAADESLTKDDVLSVADDGTHFLQNKRGWEIFGIVNQLVREGGESFTADDFKAPLGTRHGGQKPLYQWAVESGSLSDIFNYDVWEGQEDEMLEFFYEIPEDARKQVDMVSVRRDFARARGEDIREDRLAKIDVTPEKIAEAATSSFQFKQIAEKLQEAGESVLADDLHTPKADGATVFTDTSFYNNLDDVMKVLNEHGQTLSKEDFLMAPEGQKSAIEFAGEQNILPKIFDADLWVGRSEEMLELWDAVPENLKGQVNIATVLNKVDEKTFEDSVHIDENTPLQYMYTTVRGKAPVAGQADEAGLKPLGTKKGWDDLNSVYTKLHEKGVAITLDSLREDNGRGDASMIYTAVATGHFDLLQKIAENSDDRLTVEDLTRETAHGDTVLRQLADKTKLVALLKPEAWVNRVDEMKQVIDAVPEDKRGSITFDKFLYEARDLTYSAQLSVDASLTKDTLLEAIDADGSRMLGFPSVWEKIDDIREQLKAKGDDLTLNDLRQTAGPDNTPLLMTAVANDKLDSVIDIIQTRDLTAADLTTPNAKDETLLDAIVKAEKLDAVFSPEIWVGRVQEMQDLWNKVPDTARGQVNYQSVLATVDRESLKAHSPFKSHKPKVA